MKIKYGLKNVHYAIVTETADASTGAVTSTYGQTKAWPGAVSLSLEPSGEDSPFYADDSVYVMLSNNTGYSGDFESALIPEDVETEVMGQTKDASDVVVETDKDVKKYIALMFEFTGDADARRFLFYRCSLSRHAVSSQTKGESVDPQTDTTTITSTPRPDDGRIKAYTDKNSAAYSGWYETVYEGTEPEG